MKKKAAKRCHALNCACTSEAWDECGVHEARGVECLLVHDPSSLSLCACDPAVTSAVHETTIAPHGALFLPFQSALF